MVNNSLYQNARSQQIRRTAAGENKSTRLKKDDTFMPGSADTTTPVEDKKPEEGWWAYMFGGATAETDGAEKNKRKEIPYEELTLDEKNRKHCRSVCCLLLCPLITLGLGLFVVLGIAAVNGWGKSRSDFIDNSDPGNPKPKAPAGTNSTNGTASGGGCCGGGGAEVTTTTSTTSAAAASTSTSTTTTTTSTAATTTTTTTTTTA
ncbi:unnamed protein product [Amoebophrya sp. A120]|nr:unnamed protein product [Amoebophrya sp. A120]|eukprot:GSA120T00013360001.1